MPQHAKTWSKTTPMGRHGAVKVYLEQLGEEGRGDGRGNWGVTFVCVDCRSGTYRLMEEPML